MRALIKSCFLVIFAVLIISLSGCTMPYFPDNGDGPSEGVMSAELSTDLERVPVDDFTHLYLTIGNPSNLEAYTQNSYSVYAKIIDLGDFREDSDTDEQEQDMLGLKQKTFTWRLNTPSREDHPAEAATSVTVQLKVLKEEVFTMPAIVFATQNALLEAEVRGEPIQGGPKTLYFNDNFINVVVDLNQQQPVSVEVCPDNYVWANLKFTPIMGGTLNIDSIDIEDGQCEEIDNIAHTVQCQLSCETDDITERHFKMTVGYSYKINIDQRFTIYPYKV